MTNNHASLQPKNCPRCSVTRVISAQLSHDLLDVSSINLNLRTAMKNELSLRELELDLETKAPKVNDEIADVTNKLCLHQVRTDHFKALIKRHLTPSSLALNE